MADIDRWNTITKNTSEIKYYLYINEKIQYKGLKIKKDI